LVLNIGEWNNVVDSIPDDDGSAPPVVPIGSIRQNTKVTLKLEDFGGNIAMPHTGKTEPGKSYYQSKLHMHMFYDCNASTGLNRLLVYDQRAQGKGGNSMKSSVVYVIRACIIVYLPSISSIA
jgi:hypothetical protein